MRNAHKNDESSPVEPMRRDAEGGEEMRGKGEEEDC